MKLKLKKYVAPKEVPAKHPRELEEKAGMLVAYGKEKFLHEIVQLYKRASVWYLKWKMPKRSKRCADHADHYEQRSRGILDLRSLGIGMYSVQTGQKLNEKTLEPLVPRKKRQRTEEEKLEMAAVKKAAKAKAKAKIEKKKEKKEKSGDKPTIGKTLKKNIKATFVHIFAEQDKKKMTDDQISAFLKKEFPLRQPKSFDRISRVRARYNRGGLTGGKAPKVQCKAYGKGGKVVEDAPVRTRGPKKDKAKAKKKLVLKLKKGAAE